MCRQRAVLALLAASASAMPKELFDARADAVCASKDLVACSSDLPSGFCCPKDSQCVPLAGGTTALCCPEGSNCDRIQPIACSVNLQDPKGNTDPTVVTSVFNVNLEPCDNGCCPFGYSCADKIAAAAGKAGSSSGQCIRNDDQSKKPGEDSDPKSTTTTKTATTTRPATSSSAAASTTTSSHSTAPASATATPTPGSDGADGEKGMKSNTMSIIGGVVGGSLVLLIIIIIAVLYVRRRKRGTSAAQQYEKSTGYRTDTSSSSSSHHAGAATRGLNISEPIVQQDSYRTDFILKSPSAMSSISNQPVNSRWSGSTNAAPPGANQPPRTRNLTPSVALRRAQKHLSIPNPFSSPNPSATSPKAESAASSFDDSHAKTGHVVNSRLAPIRSMRSSRRVSRRTEPQQVVRKEASEESINVFADANAVPPLRQQQQQQQRGRDVHEERERDRNTTFSDLMDKADLGDVHRGKQRYVPGTTPRL